MRNGDKKPAMINKGSGYVDGTDKLIYRNKEARLKRRKAKKQARKSRQANRR